MSPLGKLLLSTVDESMTVDIHAVLFTLPQELYHSDIVSEIKWTAISLGLSVLGDS